MPIREVLLKWLCNIISCYTSAIKSYPIKLPSTAFKSDCAENFSHLFWAFVRIDLPLNFGFLGQDLNNRAM